MEPLYNENDEKLRLKRDENSGKFTVATFINWWLIPGFFGIITVLIGKIAVSLASYLPRNEPITRSISRTFKNLNEDFVHLLAFEWNETNMWTLLLFGFLLGVFIKYAYTDKKI